MGRRPKNNAVRSKSGIWINTELFRTEAKHFEKYGYYTPEPWGSPGWIAYWKEQEKRCLEGYCVGGACITGFHYFYLNFTKIMAYSEKHNRKVLRFPDFWDGDYNYFWAVELAMNGIHKTKFKSLGLTFKVKDGYYGGGYNLIVLKARRKGYSYKNAAIVTAIWALQRDSLTVIGSYLYDYAEETFKKAYRYINFLNKHTGFARSILNRDGYRYIKSGYKERVRGNWIESGYLSEIVAISYKDNPDPSRGKDARFVAFEEVGSFPNLKQAYAATEPITRDGGIKTGIIAMYGTSTTMDSASVFEEVFYNPEDYNAIPFENIWEDEEDDTKTYVGFFHPAHWNKVGFMDRQGNSDLKKALKSEKRERESKKSTQALLDYIIEYPLKPSEAFLQKELTYFPVNELKRQYQKVLSEQLYIKNSMPVRLYYEEGKVKYEVIVDRSRIEPLYFYNQKANDYSGVVLMYEPPIPNPPFGLYKIGYDPYAQDKGESLAAIYVYKGFMRGQDTHDIIVASYVGRPQDVDEANKVALMLAELYNTEVLYENMFIHPKLYFQRKGKLHRLAAQPQNVISKAIINSRVQRVYGIHMTQQIKDDGEKYIAQWLMQERDYYTDEEGNQIPIFNYETIFDIGLLEELIKYDRKRNTDRVMAFMMVMFQLKEDEEKEYADTSEDVFLQLENFANKAYFTV